MSKIPPLSDLSFRILSILCEPGNGKMTEADLFRLAKPSSLFAFRNALEQLHTQRLCAWGFDPDVGAVYQVMIYGRMRRDHEVFHERRIAGRLHA